MGEAPLCPLGFRIQGSGLGFGVWGLGFGVEGLGFGAYSLGFRVEGLGLRVLGFRAWGCRYSGTYRGTSHTRKRTPLGPFRRPMPRVLGGS